MIEIWMIFVIISIIAVVVEIFVPSLFCINFAFAGIITSIISIYWGNLSTLILIFLALSILSIFCIKPILVKLLKKSSNTDFKSQYIGKIVKSIETITKNQGAVTIYDERWEARIKEGCDDIPTGCDVKIVDNDSLILYVEKI